MTADDAMAAATVDKIKALQRVLLEEYKQAPGLFGEIARMEGLLAETYRNRVAYELLQNSDDADSSAVEIVVDNDSFEWRNDGRLLTSDDIESLCRSANSTKQRGGDTIGYRGIGFKSLAAIARSIDVHSGEVAFTFDRYSASEMLGSVDPATVPLIRVPSNVRPRQWTDGVTFAVSYAGDHDGHVGEIDPLSFLFLRNIERVTIATARGRTALRIGRKPDRIVLRDDEGEASFGLLTGRIATIAIPLDTRALALAGLRGRLACFLPLNDEVGFPVVISGDILTDPSRTHAVVADESTQAVLQDAASIIGDVLRGSGILFDLLWKFILEGDDLRSPMLAPNVTVSKLLITALRDNMTANPPSFEYSPVSFEPEDVSIIFPAGAPEALYAQSNQSSARAVKALLGLRTVNFSSILEKVATSELSDSLRQRLALHLRQLSTTHGRSLSAAEQELVASLPVNELSSNGPRAISVKKAVEPAEGTARLADIAGRAVRGTQSPLAAVIHRWRAAEVVTMEYLNGRGWKLRDVSNQNLGYDLEGTDPFDRVARIEVKKVDGPAARFSMTNNELSLMMNSPGEYLLAVIVGDGQGVKLAMLDPSRKDLPKERVCRRWEWEFTDWARFAEIVE
ncbi:sacsin N-terminal ATP-binding-like domain-containing protein [Nocardia vaccinii]|uniref:sacsin N-terminal ATP-binding-like domain-containing protein n=1 Tax=Nocardia vaccinii TaxID=1822 RepID=UPI00082EAEB3|nr:DUF3883 domain-containing protein [Nocardia vaccinii]